MENNEIKLEVDDIGITGCVPDGEHKKIWINDFGEHTGERLAMDLVQGLKLKEFIIARIGIEEFTMDEYVKDINNTHMKKSKEERDRYWQAVHMFKILTDMIEESKI